MSTARERFMNATKLVKAGRTGQSLVESPATSRERFINATRLVKLGSPQTALSGGQGNSEANSAPRFPLPPYLTGGTYTPPTPYAPGLQAKQEREQSAAPVTPQKAQTFTPKPTVQKTESEHQAFDMAMGYQNAMAAQKQAAKTQRLAQLDIGAAEKRAAELKAAAKDAKTAQTAVDADPKYTYWDGIYESAEAANEAYLADANAAWETRKKIDDELAALNQDIESAKYVQFSLLPTRDDFQVYAARGGGMKNNAVMPVKRSGDGAVIGLEVMEKLFPKTQESSPTKSIYDKLTDEEARIYNYLLAKDAERGTSHAFEYLSFMMDPMKARRGREQADLVKNSGPLRPVATVGYGLASGFDRAVTGIAQNFSDTPIPASELQYGAGYVREDLDGAGPKILGSSLGQIGFDLAVTTGNMAPSIGAGVVGGPAAAAGVTFLSAGGNAYGEALAQGYSKGEARAYGILAGASEAGLQYALSGISSLGGKLPNSEAVQSALNNIQRAALRIPAKYAVAAAGEMTEEYLQEILTPVFRNLALGENNEFKLFTEDAAYAALLAALSVGVLEGPNIVGTDLRLDKLGKNLRGKWEGDTLSVTRLLIDLGIKEEKGSDAYKAALAAKKQLDSRGTVNDVTLGTLHHDVMGDILAEGRLGTDTGVDSPAVQSGAEGVKSAPVEGHVNPGARESIRSLVGEMPSEGYDVPHISMPNDVLVGEDGSRVPESKLPSAIRKYMLKLFRGKVLNIGADNKVYISKDGVEEFSFPVRRLDDATKRAKMAAGANLDTTLAPAAFLRNTPDDGRHPKATGGWDNFYVMFETDTGVYSGIVKTMVTDRGRVFHDITEIQREGDPTTRGDNGTSPPPARTDTPSINSIPQTPTDVNPESTADTPSGRVALLSRAAQSSFGPMGQMALSGVYDQDMAARLDPDAAHLVFAKVYNAVLQGQPAPKLSGVPRVLIDAAAAGARSDLRLSQYGGAEASSNQGDGRAAMDEAGEESQTFGKVAAEPAETQQQAVEVTNREPGFDYNDGRTQRFAAALPSETEERMDAVARDLGLTIRAVDSVFDGRANAQIVGNEILIDENVTTDGVAYILGHEFTHRVKELAETEYFAFQAVLDQGNLRDTAAKIADIYRAKGVELTEAHALDEATANMAGEMLQNGVILDDFIARNRGNKTLLQKVRDWFRGIIAKLQGGEKRQGQIAVEKLTAALNAAERNVQLAESVQAGTETQYSIGYDVNNTPFVTVENDILDGVPRSEWVRTVKENLREKFPKGVTVGQSTIRIDRQSRKEMTFSRYTRYLMESIPELYADKLRATNNADEILQAARNYVNEALAHPRKDNIQDFARGEVQLRVGGHDYTAQVVVAMRSNGNLILYDVLQLAPTTIQEKKSGAAITENPSPGADRSTASGFMGSVPQEGDGVNPHYSLSGTGEASGLDVLRQLAEEMAQDPEQSGGWDALYQLAHEMGQDPGNPLGDMSNEEVIALLDEIAEGKSAGQDIASASPGASVEIGTIDFADKASVMEQLAQAQKETVELDHEVCYSVTADGKVWKVSGETGMVDQSAIPSSLVGSYSFHNHPKTKTWFSFSPADVRSFFQLGEQFAKASDYLYEYTMERTEDTVDIDPDKVYSRFKEIEDTVVAQMKWDGLIDPDMDGYHETMKLLSRELKFYYVRTKRK